VRAAVVARSGHVSWGERLGQVCVIAGGGHGLRPGVYSVDERVWPPGVYPGALSDVMVVSIRLMKMR